MSDTAAGYPKSYIFSVPHPRYGEEQKKQLQGWASRPKALLAGNRGPGAFVIAYINFINDCMCFYRLAIHQNFLSELLLTATKFEITGQPA